MIWFKVVRFALKFKEELYFLHLSMYINCNGNVPRWLGLYHSTQAQMIEYVR